MSKNLNGGGLTQRLLLAVIAAGVVIIACILVYETLNKRRAAREAEIALRELEKNRPERYVTATLAAGVPASADQEQITVSVDEGGALRLSSGASGEETVGDVELLRARLEQLVRERRGRGLDGTVVVRASPRLKYAELEKVVEAVRAAGGVPSLETGGTK